MPSKHEKAFRKLRREIRRIPNLELAEDIYTGKIGFFDSRRVTFDWRTDLNSLNIHINPRKTDEAFPVVQEMYTSGNEVDVEFLLEENNLGSASFKFSSEFAVTTQAYDLIIKSYNINEMENLLIQKIKRNEIKWDPKWIVVTKIYQCSSYTLLINSSKNSEAKISTGIPIDAPGFNIADPKLDLRIVLSRKMAYQVVGNERVTPFFMMHQLKYSKRDDSYSLVPYGRL
jgi:hypothetical protein